VPLQVDEELGPYRSNVIVPSPVRLEVPLRVAESLTVEPTVTFPDGLVESVGEASETLCSAPALHACPAAVVSPSSSVVEQSVPSP